jgi:hypothetical protein
MLIHQSSVERRMKKKMKKFDCVEMKNQIQSEMLAEYEAHKNKYKSFADFVKTEASKSPWVRQMRSKLKVSMR